MRNKLPSSSRPVRSRRACSPLFLRDFYAVPCVIAIVAVPRSLPFTHGRSVPKWPPGGLPRGVRIDGVLTPKSEPEVPLVPTLSPHHPVWGTQGD
ncbi:hypothetical protein EVAR_87088_1 [Eumeta japonica]|uniref:Uncharacterized protein n=1 Tax=Eumeta variegata TaxID=151549 RepID=A0A4C1VSP5_EUMVA|nr:hypothetical protein EVAR_87088_1 [Eumeta japonica]